MAKNIAKLAMWRNITIRILRERPNMINPSVGDITDAEVINATVNALTKTNNEVKYHNK